MLQPMAVVIIGGLTYATLLTLFVVPALYDVFPAPSYQGGLSIWKSPNGSLNNGMFGLDI